MIKLDGIVVRGLGAASGQGKYAVSYPGGTIAMQKKGFVALGVPDVLKWHNGTINVSLRSNVYIVRPTFRLDEFEWSLGEVETFDLLRCVIEHKGWNYDGYIYRPHPSVHAVHKADLVELVAEKIPGLSYGDAIKVATDKNALSFLPSPDSPGMQPL
ncbi:MAG: hypothetical protein DYH13_06025 [Alphaproteobacteria bacterium PRO2]|nr:hypothetical protein [Alphaproteobacteria bacterium PRO2]